MRNFIAKLEKAGEIVRVKAKVSTEQEITEITDRMSKSEGGGKAILFETTDSKFPVAMNLMGSLSRISLAMGVERLEELTERIDGVLHEATAPKNNLWDKLKMLPTLSAMASWLPKRVSSKGLCQDVVLCGEEAKLSTLPILKCWPHDGGRFITLPMVHTVDPSNGARNVGMYRMQVLDEHTTAMHWHIHKTGARHFDEYKRRGERMPVSVAIGGDITYAYSATTPMPENMDEYLLAGFLRGKPVKLVKCMTNDIYVPEDSDFVIEGYIDPSEELAVEGPFGDHTGFYSLQGLYPKFHVTAITHRKDAIYPATIVGVPPQEDAYIAMATERIFLSPIRFAIMPEAQDMWMPVAGTAHNLVLLSIKSRYAGEAHKIAQATWGAGQMMFTKYLLVTESTTDIRNTEQVAQLLRNMDLRTSLVRSEGVMDVLDHATATPGFGGKIALVAGHPAAAKSPSMGSFTQTEVSTKLLPEWGVLVIFAPYDERFNYANLIKEAKLNDVNFIAIFDRQAESLTNEELLWIGLANTDPRRDAELVGRSLFIDCRSKRPGTEGMPARFPNVVTSSQATIELVDRRWNEYNIGEMIESPSTHYAKLKLSNKEDW